MAHPSRLRLCPHSVSPLGVFYRDVVMGFMPHPGDPGGSHLKTLPYSCKDSFPKQGHIPRHQDTDMSFGDRHLTPPYVTRHRGLSWAAAASPVSLCKRGPSQAETRPASLSPEGLAAVARASGAAQTWPPKLPWPGSAGFSVRPPLV